MRDFDLRVRGAAPRVGVPLADAYAAMLGHRSLDMILRYANYRELHQMGENPLVA